MPHQAHGRLPGAHILTNRRRPCRRFRHLAAQSHPYPVRRVPLLSGRLAVGLQNRVDEWDRRRPVSDRSRSGIFRSAGIAMASAFRTSRLCTGAPQFPGHRPDRSGPRFVLLSDCSYSSTLALVFSKTVTSFRASRPKTRYTVYGLQAGANRSIERSQFRVANVSVRDVPDNGLRDEIRDHRDRDLRSIVAAVFYESSWRAAKLKVIPLGSALRTYPSSLDDGPNVRVLCTERRHSPAWLYNRPSQIQGIFLSLLA
jgi:hypothetical protein